MAKRSDKEQEEKERAAAAEVARQRAEGAAALDKARNDEAAKSDEQRAAEEAEALAQQEAKRQQEAERAETEQNAAAEELARIEAEAAAREEEADAANSEDPPAGYGEDQVGDSYEQELNRRLFALSPNARLLKVGTILHLNGVECVLPVDMPLVIPQAADEQQFASVLARDPRNLAINSDRLRLVYNPMNGTPLPLESQRLKLEDMTEQERALFEAPARPKR